MGATNLGSKLGENLIINPSMDIWQRGTSFPAIADAQYTADRFLYSKSGTVVHTASQSADVPSDVTDLYSHSLNVTTAQASFTTTDHCLFTQKIEGYNFRKIKGKNFLLSFRVKSPKTGIHCVSFLNSAQDRSYAVEYTINTANTWEKKTVRVKHDPTGTWDYENGLGMWVRWALAVGPTYQGTKDVWNAGLVLATANQVNVCDTIGNDFKISQVQLHEGIDEIPFEDLARDIQAETELCQRFYELVETGAVNVNNITYSHWSVSWKTAKRANPVVTIHSRIDGTINAASVNDLSSDVTAVLFNTSDQGDNSLYGAYGHVQSVNGAPTRYTLIVRADVEL